MNAWAHNLQFILLRESSFYHYFCVEYQTFSENVWWSNRDWKEIETLTKLKILINILKTLCSDIPHNGDSFLNSKCYVVTTIFKKLHKSVEIILIDY